jgi:uncharacterized membrane protein
MENIMLGLSPLGAVHTAISLVALAAGVTALLRSGAIAWNSGSGKVYVWTTVLTCLTAFGIHNRGAFNEAHGLAVITLIVIGVAWAAAGGKFGARSGAVETVALSLTFYFHLIPAITETSLRLPLGAPLASSPTEPWLKAATGILFLGFLVVAWLQVRRRHAPAGAAA